MDLPAVETLPAQAAKSDNAVCLTICTQPRNARTDTRDRDGAQSPSLFWVHRLAKANSPREMLTNPVATTFTGLGRQWPCLRRDVMKFARYGSIAICMVDIGNLFERLDWLTTSCLRAGSGGWHNFDPVVVWMSNHQPNTNRTN
jgi:hypothetical protein